MTSQAPLRAVGVSDEVGVDPLDRVADMCGRLGRHEREFFHPDLDNFGARRSRDEGEKERAERPDGRYAIHPDGLFELGRNVFGMLLMPLKDLQAGREQVLELRIAG